MEEQRKINLIYIASIGRSGTTLLESMLGAHSQMATCGELHIWPHEIRQGGVRPCSCGRFVEDCPFWSAVRGRVDPLRQPSPRLEFFREAHHAGRTLRPERLRTFGTEKLSGAEAEQVRTYGANNAAIYRAFLDEMESATGRRPRWVVDASKDVYRLLWLVRSGLFNVKVLHNVKNPRAFVYSVTKRFIHGAYGTGDGAPNGAAPASTRLYYTARQSLAWSVRNHLITKLAKNHLRPEDYLLVRYEKLASRPEATFREICATIGVEAEAGAVEGFREGSFHTIAGNPMRYEQKGIVLDERWKEHLPASSRRVAELVTVFNRARYGYR